MAGTIKLDYDATLSAAKSISSVADVIKESRQRARSAENNLRSCEGKAAQEAREAIGRLEKALDGFGEWDMQLGQKFADAAMWFTQEDEKAARELTANWNSSSKEKKA